MANENEANSGAAAGQAPASGAAEGAPETGKQEQSQGSADVVTKAEHDARVKALNAEAAQHRLAAKKAKEELERVKAALGVPGEAGTEAKGKAAPDASAALEQKLRTTMLKSAFVSEAAKHGVVDAGDAFELARGLLKEVTIDLDAETVDSEAVESVVASLREKKPYLFAKAAAATKPVVGAATPKAPVKVPDGGGTPTAGGTPYTQWRQLHAAGDKSAADNFFIKNKKAINDTWPRGK